MESFFIHLYSKTILHYFLLSNEQKVTRDEKRLTSNEQKVMSNEQKLTTNKQKVSPPQNITHYWEKKSYYCENKGEKMLKEEESIEILNILGLIENI